MTFTGSNGSATICVLMALTLFREVLYVGPDVTPLLRFKAPSFQVKETLGNLVELGSRCTWNEDCHWKNNRQNYVSVEDKEQDGIEYRELVADTVSLDSRFPYETAFTAPQLGGHAYWDDLHNQWWWVVKKYTLVMSLLMVLTLVPCGSVPRKTTAVCTSTLVLLMNPMGIFVSSCKP